MTPEEIIYHRRVQVLDRAGQTSVTEACRTFGVSRTSYYRWAGRRPALRPGRAGPQGPAAAGDAERDPTRPGRERARRGGGPPHHRRSASGRPPGRPRGAAVGLRRPEDPQPPSARAAGPASGCPGPAHRRHDRHPDHPRPRMGRSGSATSPPGPVTWSPWTPSMSADSKASGRSGSSPPSTPPPAMGSASWSPGTSRPATPPASSTTSPSAWPASGSSLAAVLTDNGPEFTAKTFTEPSRGASASRHHRIPPRSPNHNAVCERFQGTALQEFYRPAFHRQHFARLADLNAQFQGWLQHYNTRRRNHGDFMRGRTPYTVMQGPPTMTTPRVHPSPQPVLRKV